MRLASALLPIMPVVLWLLAITGGLVAFVASAHSTVSLVSSNAHTFIRPIVAARSFNVPPVEQIGQLYPLGAPADDETEPAAPTERLQAAAVETAPAGPAAALPLGRIGSQAVNVRAAPAKGAAKIGVLHAGTEVRIGGIEQGWVRVSFSGGSGWVYSDYVALPAEITIRGGKG